MLKRVPWSYRLAVLLFVPAVMLFGHLILRGQDHGRGVEVSIGPSVPRFLDESLIRSSLDSTPLYVSTNSTPLMLIEVEVRPDHSLSITERIGEYFTSRQRGIFRDIPLVDEDGKVRRIRSVEVRTTPGTPDDVKLGSFDEGLRIRIGDQNRRVVLDHGYQITYVVEDAMIPVDGRDDIARFEFTSPRTWTQPITRLGFEIVGPAEPAVSECRIDGESCRSVEVTSNGVVVRVPDGSYTTPSVRFQIDFPRDAFDPTPTVESRPFLSTAMAGTTLASFLAVLLGYGVHDLRRRRSRRLVAGSIDATFAVTDSLVDRHPGLRHLSEQLASEHSTTSFPDQPPIEFVPPLGLDPAQVHRVSGRGSPNRLMASTLLDLAADGVIDLVPDGRSFRASRREQPPRDVTAYELVLLKALLGDEPTALVSKQTVQLRAARRAYLAALDESLRQRGLGSRFSSAREAKTPKSRHIEYAVTLGVVTVAPIYFAQDLLEPTGVWFSAAGAGLIALGWGLLDQWRSLGGLSPLGRAAAYRILGFERFFTESEGRQARFAERRGLLREYMGYALAFDSLREWVRLAPPDAIPSDWRTFDPIRFGDLTKEQGFVRPKGSSDGPSGFTGGGGGFSGGGGGGGRW
jgi:uncharacterized membrane protein YgcG